MTLPNCTSLLVNSRFICMLLLLALSIMIVRTLHFIFSRNLDCLFSAKLSFLKVSWSYDNEIFSNKEDFYLLTHFNSLPPQCQLYCPVLWHWPLLWYWLTSSPLYVDCSFAQSTSHSPFLCMILPKGLCLSTIVVQLHKMFHLLWAIQVMPQLWVDLLLFKSKYDFYISWNKGIKTKSLNYPFWY